MSIFGSDYKGRKNQPIFHFLVRYFPKALAEVTKVCVAGNVQHNPELDPTDINWSRDKSTDQLNTAMRHMMDHATSGPFDTEPLSVQKIIGGNTYHLAKAAWRVLAELELQIERDQAPKPTTLTDITAAGESLEWVDTTGRRQFTPLVYSKPKCPVCSFTEHVVHSDALKGAFMCKTGHPAFHFNANGDSV